MRAQPKLKDRRGNAIPRLPAFSALDPRIKSKVLAECRRYGVSASFVIANALAFVFDVDVVDYRARRRKKEQK